MENPVLPSSCVTPAGTSIEVQNEWEENRQKTHTHHSSRPIVQQYVCMVITYSKSMDQPGKVANPARGQLNREMNISLSAFAPKNLVSRDGFGSPFPRQPAQLHTQAESGAYIRDSSRFPQRRPLLYLKRPDAIESVPSISDHVIAYRWRSLPRVRRHRASKTSR